MFLLFTFKDVITICQNLLVLINVLLNLQVLLIRCVSRSKEVKPKVSYVAFVGKVLDFIFVFEIFDVLDRST